MDTKLDTLADKVLKSHLEFNSKLHSQHSKFPREEFEALFEAVKKYAEEIGEGNLIHRDVAREINGIREYLQLQGFKTPDEVIAKADRMETILFSGYDPYFEGFEPPG